MRFKIQLLRTSMNLLKLTARFASYLFIEFYIVKEYCIILKNKDKCESDQQKLINQSLVKKMKRKNRKWKFSKKK